MRLVVIVRDDESGTVLSYERATAESIGFDLGHDPFLHRKLGDRIARAIAFAYVNNATAYTNQNTDVCHLCNKKHKPGTDHFPRRTPGRWPLF